MPDKEINMLDFSEFITKINSIAEQIENELSNDNNKREVSIYMKIPEVEIEFIINGKFSKNSLDNACYVGLGITRSGVSIEERGNDLDEILNSVKKKYEDWKNRVLRRVA